MTDTPETDEFFMRANIDWDMEVQFARKLERERDDLIVSLNFHADLNKELIRQRDRLAKACDQYSEDEILCKLQEITEQRDRLAMALEYILGIGLTQKTKAKAEKALQND